MVEIVKVTEEFAIGPQISRDDLRTIRDAGYASVINLRPDDEEGEFLTSAQAEEIARSLGLGYAYSPTENHAIFETDIIDRFERAMADLPKPIYTHCKSGTRSAILWALVAARHREVEDVIETLRAAGQELDFLEQEMRDSAEAARESPFRLRDDGLLGLGRSKLLGGDA